MAARIVKIDEVSEKMTDGDTLCFQYAEYQYGDGGSDYYYRFIRKDSEGRYKSHRGQAGIPDTTIITRLMEDMEKIRPTR